MKPHIQSALLLFLLGSSGVSAQSRPEGYYAGSNHDTTNGTTIPWVEGGTSRYQQVYSAALFTNRVVQMPAAGAFLTYVEFSGEIGSKRGWYVTNLIVSASTTSRGPDQLSRIFSENVGIDDLKIFVADPRLNPRIYAYAATPGDSDDFSSLKRGLQDPWEAFRGPPLDVSFFYSPAKGNLLLDFRNHGSRYDRIPWDPYEPEWWKGGRHAVAIATNDRVSRVFASSVNATEAELVDSAGLYTRMVFRPIPKLRIRKEADSIVLRWEGEPREFELQISEAAGDSITWRQYLPAAEYPSPEWREATILLADLPRGAFFRLFWDTPQVGVPTLQAVVENQN